MINKVIKFLLGHFLRIRKYLASINWPHQSSCQENITPSFIHSQIERHKHLTVDKPEKRQSMNDKYGRQKCDQQLLSAIHNEQSTQVIRQKSAFDLNNCKISNLEAIRMLSYDQK